eukprot:5670928-Lingulodinium_polyedra.AAC.1
MARPRGQWVEAWLRTAGHQPADRAAGRHRPPAREAGRTGAGPCRRARGQTQSRPARCGLHRG